MTDNTQPEALDLADWLEAVGGGPSAKRCAALLREQHARIAELESQLAQRFDAADVATASAQGFRDGVASVSAGSEPVATVFTMEALTPGGGVKYHATIHKALPAGTKLYTHPYPKEGMAGWTKASDQLPPCRDDQLYIGVNSAGFAGVFNAVTCIDGHGGFRNVHCHYETAEESIDVMSDLSIWQTFTQPATGPADGESNG